jgi:hypothetical protein
MRLTRFGTVVLPAHQAESSLPVGARSSLVPLPGGAFDQDGKALYLTPQQLSFRCVLAEDIDATRDALLRELGKGRRVVEATMRDGVTKRVTWAKLVGVERESRPGLLGCQPIILRLEQDYPYWLAAADAPSYLDTGEILDGEWAVGGNFETITIDGLSVAHTITNDGGAAAPHGILTATLGAGDSVTDLKVYNDANGMWLRRDGTLTASDVWEVKLLPKAVHKNGADDYANLSIGDDQLDWMVLELGDNPITITATALTGSFDLIWCWGRHYL